MDERLNNWAKRMMELCILGSCRLYTPEEEQEIEQLHAEFGEMKMDWEKQDMEAQLATADEALQNRSPYPITQETYMRMRGESPQDLED